MESRLNSRNVWLLSLALLVSAVVAEVLLLRMRGNIELVADKSLPALRLASDMDNIAAGIQIRLLSKIVCTGARPQGDEVVVLQGMLKQSAALIDDYAKTILHETDRQNYAAVIQAFAAYRKAVEHYLMNGAPLSGNQRVYRHEANPPKPRVG